MDEKFLKLLKDIKDSADGITQDKINRLEKEAYAPRTEVKRSLPPEERQWFQVMQPTPQGMTAGNLPPPKWDAFLDAFGLKHEPKLDIQEFAEVQEGIPQNTSDPRRERFNKLFNK